MIGRRLRLVLARDHGATAVEFALVLAVLLPLVLGVIEFGRALHARNALDYVADRAARSLMVDYRQTDLGLVQLETLLEDTAREDAPGLWPENLTLTLMREGAVWQVEVSYPFEFLIPIIPVADIVLSARRTVPAL